MAVGCSPDEGPQAVPAAQQQLLEPLGYVDYADRRDDAGDGTLVFNRDHSAPGLNLITYPRLRRAVLIDADGQRVRGWTGDPPGSRWERVIALPGGDILAITRSAGLVRVGSDGTVRWVSDSPAHHFVAPLPDGRIMARTVRKRIVRGFSRIEVAEGVLPFAWTATH